MQQTALSWLIYRMPGSPFMLGLIGFTSQAPSLLVAPFAGIIADRANRHRLLLTTQALGLVQAALLAALVLSGQTQLWHLVALSTILGVTTAFDMPTWQTFMVDLLDDKDQVASAIGISSSINTSTRFIGPFLAGLLIAWAGEGLLLFGQCHQLCCRDRGTSLRQIKPAPRESLEQGRALTV